jgi:hypothetical protein
MDQAEVPASILKVGKLLRLRRPFHHLKQISEFFAPQPLEDSDVRSSFTS